MRRSWSKLACKCIPYNNRCVHNFIQIGSDLTVRGPKTCFRVETEHGQANYLMKFIFKRQTSISMMAMFCTFLLHVTLNVRTK